MDYNDLRIYQLAKKLQNELYQDIIKIQYSWKIAEVDQVKRSSSSSSSNIVEGFGRKFYPKDFFRFLNISLASSDETQNHIITLNSKGYLDKIKSDYFVKNYKTLSIQTLNFMNFLRKKHKF